MPWLKMSKQDSSDSENSETKRRHNNSHELEDFHSYTLGVTS